MADEYPSMPNTVLPGPASLPGSRSLQIHNRMAYTDYNEDLDDIDLRRYVERNTAKYREPGKKTIPSFHSLSAEIQLVMLRIVAINNMGIIQQPEVHKFHQNCGRARTLDPRRYISTHLFKARTLCRSFASLGAEIYKQLIQEERYEHYRRVVFPNHAAINDIMFAIGSQRSQLRAAAVDGIEFRLYRDGPIPSFDELKQTIEEHNIRMSGLPAPRRMSTGGLGIDASLGQRRVESTGHTGLDTNPEQCRKKLEAVITRQLQFVKWLKSPTAVSVFQKLSNLIPHPMRLFLVEPKVMPVWENAGCGSIELVDGDLRECELASLVFEAITRVQLEVQDLFWVARRPRFPFAAIEDSTLAQNSLLNLRSVHIFITSEVAEFDMSAVGRFLMEFCKNVAHLTIEMGECEQTFHFQLVTIQVLLESIPRVKSLTLLRGGFHPTAITGYLSYAKDTIEELHLQDADSVFASAAVGFADFVLEEVPGLRLKKFSIVPAQTTGHIINPAIYDACESAAQLLTIGAPN